MHGSRQRAAPSMVRAMATMQPAVAPQKSAALCDSEEAPRLKMCCHRSSPTLATSRSSSCSRVRAEKVGDAAFLPLALPDADWVSSCRKASSLLSFPFSLLKPTGPAQHSAKTLQLSTPAGSASDLHFGLEALLSGLMMNSFGYWVCAGGPSCPSALSKPNKHCSSQACATQFDMTSCNMQASHVLVPSGLPGTAKDQHSSCSTDVLSPATITAAAKAAPRPAPAARHCRG